MSFLGVGHDLDHFAFGECGSRDECSDHTLHVLVYDGGISQANGFCWLCIKTDCSYSEEHADVFFW